jgi:hypothetical protein
VLFHPIAVTAMLPAICQELKETLYVVYGYRG